MGCPGLDFVIEQSPDALSLNLSAYSLKAMNAPSLFRLPQAALAIALAIGLVSCTSPIERRIASNPEIYNKLPDSDKTLVSQGRIREGLGKEGVFLAWGRPDDVAGGSSRGVKTEKWTYVSSRPVYTDTFWGGPGWGWGGGFGYGRGYGYYGAWDPYWAGYGYGPSSVTYVPYKAGSVTFKNNRVVEYLRGPQ